MQNSRMAWKSWESKLAVPASQSTKLSRLSANMVSRMELLVSLSPMTPLPSGSFARAVFRSSRVQPIRLPTMEGEPAAVSIAKRGNTRHSFPLISSASNTRSITPARPRLGSDSMKGHRSSSIPRAAYRRREIPSDTSSRSGIFPARISVFSLVIPAEALSAVLYSE